VYSASTRKAASGVRSSCAMLAVNLLHFADSPFETRKRFVEGDGKLVDFIARPTDRQPAIEFRDIDPLCGADDAGEPATEICRP
jgi:hypothetical protein